jgi:HemY protein
MIWQKKTIKYHLSNHIDNWDQQLIKLYGLIKSSNLKQQIKTAEKWLSTHNQDPYLLLTVGRLAMQQGLLGKAKNYLEKSLHIQDTPDCYAELGRLAGLMGEKEQSFICYQKGLSTITETVEL